MAMPRPDWIKRLKLPLIVAPMFLASGPALVLAACRAGVVGTFPVANARGPEQLDAWFDEIERGLADSPDAAPFGVNIVLSRRPGADALREVCERRKPPVVISSIGDPQALAQAVHGWGGTLFHDVTTVRHAEKAAEAGVDGIILVCAGAGGHSGAVSPFALTPQVRARFDGLIVLAGSISDGRSILAAQTLGADLVYMGTRFLATRESTVSDAYKALILQAETKDILYTPSISGLPANFIRQSVEAAGLDPDHLPPPKGVHEPDLPPGVRAWRDVWSAGQGVGLIEDIPTTAELVARLTQQYDEARRAFAPAAV
jgi:nitronate monooxygenase